MSRLLRIIFFTLLLTAIVFFAFRAYQPATKTTESNMPEPAETATVTHELTRNTTAENAKDTGEINKPEAEVTTPVAKDTTDSKMKDSNSPQAEKMAKKVKESLDALKAEAPSAANEHINKK